MPSADSDRDKLAHVIARGSLLLSVDPAYPPASFAVEGATRITGTRCEANQLTGDEVDGYDVAVSKLVAEALGVEPCFVTPTWLQILGGHWSDRWDLAFASIGITTSRMTELYFTRPYYATPEKFYVAKESSYQAMEDLDGKRIGVCSDCFADLYLQKRLDVPGANIEYRVDGAVIVRYQTEQGGLEDVANGKLDAFLCQVTAGDQAIAGGLALRSLEPAPYAAYPAGVVDRSSALSVKSLLERVNKLLTDRLADGTLATLSSRYFGSDFATLASSYDLAALAQDVH